MRVLHLIDHMGIGGAQTLAKMMAEEIPNSFLFSLSKNKNTFLSKFLPHSFLEVKKIIVDKRISIVHAHLFKSKFFSIFLKILLFPNMKLIFHEHGNISNKLFYKLFLLTFDGFVDKYIAISKKVEAQIYKEVGVKSNKVILIENCVNLKKPESKEVVKFGRLHSLKKSAFKIGFVGRLHKEKGCELLIKAASYIKFPYQVLVVGDGPERKNLEKLTSLLGLNENVIFTGRLNEASLAYSSIDVLVAPSTDEPFGLVALEAQLFGVPVIVSKSFEGVVSAENAVILDKLEAQNLSRAILRIYEFPDLKEKIISAGYKNIEKFSKEYFLNILLTLYERSFSGNSMILDVKKQRNEV